MAFITEFGNYCYKVMPFGLKNEGAIYQRLMDKVFAKQIGRNIEVYVDDMVAKTQLRKDHIDDLSEIFEQIQHYNMHLNPEKCAFAVQGELTTPSADDHTTQWSLYVDGSSNNEGCGAGIRLQSDDGFILEYSLHLTFKASNNQSEYEALVAGLCLCSDLHISTLKTNGLAEAANKIILHALKKKLDDAKGLWAELIPEILWGYNTTPQSSTRETPFRLVYGSESMIPLEISHSSVRTQIGNQDEARRAELDLIEEIRETSTL
ncbi:uncharacterized protein LOC130957469 [Arachis stenosperma]|uniref:uncharacterized protein LOC130957469 n=1 Tax=Arachis stenosperma TaxID=217475 RepID=UPI0025AD24FB|nr:uncharacterized protein LOC130957469 [Arachis stenosperma]